MIIYCVVKSSINCSKVRKVRDENRKKSINEKIEKVSRKPIDKIFAGM